LSKPFEGIKVLDLTHVLAGPFCAWQFALLGADVIKIEQVGAPDCARGRGPDAVQNAALRGLNYQVQGSNKRAIALDLGTAPGRAILETLIRSADVLIENYRTGALEALGFGYAAVARLNPAIVYCSITGFGGEGPRATERAYDNVIQAASGVIMQSGGAKPGVSFVDYTSGYNAAFAISAALFRRQREGRGSHITCSMYETALLTMAPELAAALSPVQTKRDKEAGIASYETADGTLMLGAFTPKQNARLWAALREAGFDSQGFEETPDWEALWAKSTTMRAALATIFKTKDARTWAQWLHEVGLPGAPVITLAEAACDPQLAARGFLQQVDAGTGDTHAPVFPVAAYRFAEDGATIERPAPGFGEHTDEVLAELGFSTEEIAGLRLQGVIA
jgi:crotonobetainyl-CoA:carnitine CoA-transferase CaiB-like acyl-CoA transferase